LKPSELLADGMSWCRNEFATDANGKQCGIWSPHATRFCILGAVMRLGVCQVVQAEALIRRTEAYLAFYEARKEQDHCPGRSIGEFNDWAPHATVLAALREAGL